MSCDILCNPCVGGGIVVPSGTIPAFSNFVIPRTLHLDNGAGAAVVLPAAGGFTAQAFFSIPPGTKKIAFDCVYTRGIGGGFPAHRIQWSNSVEVTRAQVIDQTSLAILNPNGLFNVYLEEPLEPPPPDATPISYKLEYEVPAGESGVRLLAAERGATGTPGTLLITLTGRG